LRTRITRGRRWWSGREWCGVRRDREIQLGHPRRLRRVLRPARRQHGILYPRESTGRDGSGLAQWYSRNSGQRRAKPAASTGTGHIPVRREGSGIIAVECRCPEIASLAVSRMYRMSATTATIASERCREELSKTKTQLTLGPRIWRSIRTRRSAPQRFRERPLTRRTCFVRTRVSAQSGRIRASNYHQSG
jgi:hypothetical protein